MNAIVWHLLSMADVRIRGLHQPMKWAGHSAVGSEATHDSYRVLTCTGSRGSFLRWRSRRLPVHTTPQLAMHATSGRRRALAPPAQRAQWRMPSVPGTSTRLMAWMYDLPTWMSAWITCRQ